MMSGLSLQDNGNSKQQSTNKHLQSLLNELENQFQTRMDALQADLEDSKNQQTQAFMKGMLQIPKNVRQMKVSEFQALYKMDLIAVAQKVRNDVLSKKRALPEVASNTPSRMARRGEALL